MASCEELVILGGAVKKLYTYSGSHLWLIELLNELLGFLEMGAKPQYCPGAQLQQWQNWYSCQSHTNVIV